MNKNEIFSEQNCFNDALFIISFMTFSRLDMLLLQTTAYVSLQKFKRVEFGFTNDTGGQHNKNYHHAENYI